jgi:NADH-quinone oxidoreductase subunit M
LLVAIVENRLHTQDIREMGGIAKLSPWFTVSLVVASLANIGFQMTNGFVGEFMMFNGLFKSTSPYHIVFTVFAGTGIIVGAAYTLNMIQKVAYGDVKANTSSFSELSINEKIGMGIILLLIVVLGFYPKFLMDLIYVDQVFQP